MNTSAVFRRTQQFWLFARKEEEPNLVAVIKWWELRRIPYNLIVGGLGVFTFVVTLLVAAIASDKFGEPLGLPDPPIVAVFAVVFYAVMANVCYTGGWIIELVVRSLWKERAGDFGQISFTLGILFSALLTLAPAVVFTAFLIFRLILG
jgi:magnesium-transporting ATPase (P-type)